MNSCEYSVNIQSTVIPVIRETAFPVLSYMLLALRDNQTLMNELRIFELATTLYNFFEGQKNVELYRKDLSEVLHILSETPSPNEKLPPGLGRILLVEYYFLLF